MLQTSGSRRCVYQTAPLTATFRAVFFACMDCFSFCHTGIQTLYFYSQGSSTIMLSAGTQTEWQIEQTLWSHKEKKRGSNFLQIPARCAAATYLFSLFCVLPNSLNLTDSLYTTKRCYVSPWTFSPMGKRLGNCLDFINRARCVCGFRLMAFRLWEGTEASEFPAAVRPGLGERVNPLTHFLFKRWQRIWSESIMPVVLFSWQILFWEY